MIDFDTREVNDWLVVNQFTVIENTHERLPSIHVPEHVDLIDISLQRVDV